MNGRIPTLTELVEQWTIEGHRPLGRNDAFIELLKELEFLSKKYYSRFVPALFPPHTPDFLGRLTKWLHNEGLTPEQQRLLFQFALKIAYISFDDFLQLYRSAFVGPVTRWVVDELEFSLKDADFATRIDEELRKHTWYCPVTDSMVISEFYHANGITNIDQRPALRPMVDFSAPKRLREYMDDHNLTRLVIMEDFVGTGTQARNVVKWAVKHLRCPVLFVPLVICPAGLKKFSEVVKEHPRRLRVEPILVMDDSVFVIPGSVANDRLLNEVAALAKVVHCNVAGIPDTSFGPFGFGDTGGAIVLFSNTPDNSLPMIHHHCRPPSRWQALFPRVSRETL